MSVFAVSKVRLDPQGHVSGVLWGVVDTKSNHWVSPEVAASVAQVADAIRNGDHVVALFPAADGHVPGPQFVVAENGSGQNIALEGPPKPGRGIADMDQLDS